MMPALSFSIDFLTLCPDAVCLGLFLDTYEEKVKKSWTWKELRQVRNSHSSFGTPLGLWGGLAYNGLFVWLLRGKEPWTFKYSSDHNKLRPAKECKPIDYPKADGKITFDLLDSVALTGW